MCGWRRDTDNLVELLDQLVRATRVCVCVCVCVASYLARPLTLALGDAYSYTGEAGK